MVWAEFEEKEGTGNLLILTQKSKKTKGIKGIGRNATKISV
jgi:hypothetical protein